MLIANSKITINISSRADLDLTTFINYILWNIQDKTINNFQTSKLSKTIKIKQNIEIEEPRYQVNMAAHILYSAIIVKVVLYKVNIMSLLVS